ncbi:MAG: metallophosphoesterase family protein [Acidithiobacillus sp.]|jgi:calcineurin-like phosphoesterase family protein|nr:metallophosphoesterase family protein [Acidithiobacillus sp.]
MGVFFTSDLHFGHKNIIDYCKRPFASVEAMDRALIRAWNARIEPEDTVFVLGDFAFESHARATYALSQLNGEKILIQGNHDKVSTVNGWKEIHDSLLLRINGTGLFLYHYPLRDWPGKWKGVIHLYGHVHGNLEPLPGTMDVGVDTWGGAPVSLREIVKAVTPFDPSKERKQAYVQKAWKHG